jgi:hypothetical protein
MVCKKCEKKLIAVAAPDTWKEGSNNAVGNYTSFFFSLSLSFGNIDFFF